MKILKSLLLMLIAVQLAGCAFGKIAPEDRQTLRRVSIEPITLPPKPVVITGKGGAAFIIAGPIGMMVEQGFSDMPGAYKTLLDQNKIDIAANIRNEIKTQFKAKGIEVVENGAPADAVLTVQVLQYGLTGSIFSDGRWPGLWVNFKLAKPNGDTMWKDYAAAHITKDIVTQMEPLAVPIEQYFNDPAVLKQRVEKVTELVVMAGAGSL